MSGSVEEEETGRPLVGLVVAVFDEDLFFDDRLGMAITDKDGRFELFFDSSRFRDLFESDPDIYLKIYDATGAHMIFETQETVRRNASRDEKFKLKIPARNLRISGSS